MNKKYLLLTSCFALLAGLTSCGGNDESKPDPDPGLTTTMTLQNFVKLLAEDANTYEVEEAISSTSVNTTETDNYTNVVSETGFFLEEGMSFFDGKSSRTYKKGTSKREDTYTKVAQAKSYGLNKVFYLVTDYDKEEYEVYSDLAYRLPVVQKGEADKDGVEYLLESSLPNQLSGQIAVKLASFITANLTNNINLNGYPLPDVNLELKNDKAIYTFDEFGYEYDEDGTNFHVSISFEATLTTDNRLEDAKTVYELVESNSDSSYTSIDTYEYSVVYGDKTTYDSYVENGGKIINPEDYFLTETKSVAPFYYGDKGKVFVDLDKLPIGRYVKFDAKDYLPAKSVDIEMEVKSISNITNNAFKLDNGSLYASDIGSCTVNLESMTGVTFSVDVQTIRPSIDKLTITDVYSGLESLESGVMKAYAGKSYKGIRVSASPTGIDLSDIGYEVSNPDLLTITELNREKNKIEYQFDFKSGSENNEVEVTFFSKADPSIKVSKKYKIVSQLTYEQIIEKMIANKYEWTNIYTYNTYQLTFQSNTNGTYKVFDAENKLVKEVKFTYEVSKDNLNFKMTPVNADDKFDYDFDFNDSWVNEDATLISIYEGEETYRTEVYKIVNEAK